MGKHAKHSKHKSKKDKTPLLFRGPGEIIQSGHLSKQSVKELGVGIHQVDALREHNRKQSGKDTKQLAANIGALGDAAKGTGLLPDPNLAAGTIGVVAIAGIVAVGAFGAWRLGLL